MSDVICVGVMVADILAQGVDPTVFERDMTRVSQIKLATGGDAFNQATNLANLGLNVSLVGKVGTDEVGDFLLAQASKRGITANVTRDSTRPTSTTIVLVQENGERHFIGTLAGTNSSITADDLKFEPSAPSIVSLGSLYGSVTLTGAVCKQILEPAKAAGCTTVVDIMHGDRSTMEDAAMALDTTDYFLPNLDEAQKVTKESDIDKICDILLNHVKIAVVIKLGSRGCYVRQHDQPGYYVDSVHVSNVVDTTGAGDAFVSGFIYGLKHGQPLQECARMGCICGARTVQVLGATDMSLSKSIFEDSSCV